MLDFSNQKSSKFISSDSQTNLETYKNTLSSKVSKKKSTRVDNSRPSSISQSTSGLIKKSSNNLSSKISSSRMQRKNVQSKQISAYTNNDNLQKIQRVFKMFCKNHIGFNELILGLKCLGIDISSEQRFVMVKNIFDEVKKNNLVENLIDCEQFHRIAIKLLNDEKNKDQSQLNYLQKAYYYMIQEGNYNNNMQISSSRSINITSFKQFQAFKNHIQKQSSQKKFLTNQSLSNLVKYLHVQKQYSQNDINSILEYVDGEGKGYLNFQDIVRCLAMNQLMQEE